MGAFEAYEKRVSGRCRGDQSNSRDGAILDVVTRTTGLGFPAEPREQFIAVLGYDLRNPLMSISAGAARLQGRPEPAVETGRIMQRSAGRMAGPIDNLLDFARGRLCGGLILDCDAEEPLQPTLTQVVEEHRSICPECVIEADRACVAQLFSNLLGNAIVHGAPDEPINVSASTRGGQFELSVMSGCAPTPHAAFEWLSQPFFRGEAQHRQEGLGLGLSIGSEIARAHGGDIHVVSTAEETRFTLRMPMG